MVFSAYGTIPRLQNISVSIPSRGLWFFPLRESECRHVDVAVSIPSRGLWFFPLVTIN